MIFIAYKTGDTHIVLREARAKVTIPGIGECEITTPMNGLGFYLEFPDGTIISTDINKILEEMVKLYVTEMGGVKEVVK